MWGPKVPTLKGATASLSCVQCFLYLVSSSINVFFHVTGLDTFWKALGSYWLVRERHVDVREKHQLIAFCMCYDWGSNPQPFGVQDNVSTSWATWPGPYSKWLHLELTKAERSLLSLRFKWNQIWLVHGQWCDLTLAETPLELYFKSLGSWTRFLNESLTEEASSVDTDGSVSSIKNTGKKKGSRDNTWSFKKGFHKYNINYYN